MNSLIPDESRAVVPRLRRSSTFADAPESLPTVLRRVEAPSDSWFQQSYLDWKENGGVGYLADAFSAALVENGNAYLPELARAISEAGDAVPKALQQAANSVLNPVVNEDVIELQSFEVMGPEVLGRWVGSSRQKLREAPRNAFLWHDLAYAYLMLGENEKAERAMLSALRLSSNHRLIVRSAARMFLHNKDPRRALQTIARSERSSVDPWLMSAHVAISQGLGVASPLLKKSRRILDSGATGVAFSELGMAVATEEFRSGKARSARALAKSAIRAPTENALAQGVWLSKRLNLEVELNSIDTPSGAYEAKAWDAYYAGGWEETLRNSLAWLVDQPFSSRPAILGSFVASTFVRDFALAEKIARFSLRTNANDWMLTNNLAVALAEQDRVQEAQSIADSMDVPSKSDSNYIVWLATRGLLRYRAGDIEAARNLYKESSDLSRVQRDRTSQLVGAVYQSMEEARLGFIEEAASLLTGVRKELSHVDNRDSQVMALIESSIVSLGEQRQSSS